jgi:Xaa-Pro aminopeptidase
LDVEKPAGLREIPHAPAFHSVEKPMARTKKEITSRCLSRARAVFRLLRQRKAAPEAILVSRVQDVSYLSGFTGDDSMLLLVPDGGVLLTDARYDEQARQECPQLEIVSRKGAMSDAVAEAVSQRKIRKLAFQEQVVSVALHAALASKLGNCKLLAVSEVVTHVRQQKDQEEVRCIRRSASIAQKAFGELIKPGRKAFIGRSECEVAAELEYLMRKHGAQGPSFETIVAAGPHGSKPHHRPGQTRIRPDQAVLIDWGALADGYCSDLTRVVFTGRIPPKIAEIYEVVLEAQQAAIGAIRSGRGVHTIDAAARDALTEAGYGDQFVHGLGHGIGREIHEAPALSPRGRVRLRKGMVVTVEPGVYLPGVGGVRIEDDVLVQTQGQEVLTSLPKTLSAMELR